MKKILKGYVLTNGTISPDGNKTMGNNNFYQMWKLYIIEDNYGNIKNWECVSYKTNIRDTFKDTHYGKSVLRDWRDEDLKKLKRITEGEE